jgi:hypothetical protein
LGCGGQGTKTSVKKESRDRGASTGDTTHAQPRPSATPGKGASRVRSPRHVPWNEGPAADFLADLAGMVCVLETGAPSPQTNHLRA